MNFREKLFRVSARPGSAVKDRKGALRLMQHCITHCTFRKSFLHPETDATESRVPTPELHRVCTNTVRMRSSSYDQYVPPPAVKIPESIASNDPPAEIPVFDSEGVAIGFAHYYPPDGYRIAILPEFEPEFRNKPQTRTLITDDSGKITGITIAISDSTAV